MLSQFLRNRLPRLFKGPLGETNNLYKVVTLDFGDQEQLAQVIPSILERKVDAFLIKNALAPQTVQTLLDYYNQLLKDDKTINIDLAGTYPKSFLTKMYERKAEDSYWESNPKVNEDCLEKTGIDVERLINKTLTSLAPRFKISTKPGPDGKGSFAPFQYRAVMEGPISNIHIHCENCHQSWAPELNDSLGEQKIQPRPIPFFFTLQKSKGGRIVLYDLKWKAGQTIERISDNDFYVVDPSGKKIDCSENSTAIARQAIDTDPGDLFIFNGGEIWHLVEHVFSAQKRITLGAFINIKNIKELEVWA